MKNNINNGVLGIIIFNHNQGFKQNNVYMFKSTDDLKDLNIENTTIKNMVENCFLNGINELNIVFSEKDNIYENIDKLILNKNIKYLVFDFIDHIDYQELNDFIENKNITAAFIPEEEIKNTNTSINRLIFYILEKGCKEDFIISLASLASVVARYNMPEPFKNKKIFGNFNNIVISKLTNVSIKKHGEDFYIGFINFLNGESIETIIKKEYVLNYIKSKLNKNFKNRVNTSTKLDAIRCQFYIILKKFMDKNIIEAFEVPIVYIENQKVVVEIIFTVKDYLKSIVVKINIIV